MKNQRILIISAVAIGMNFLTWIMPTVWAKEEAKGTQNSWDFENVSVGQLPEGWKVEGTNQRGPLATWKVIDDDSAPSGKRILALTSPNHDSGSTFNICWTDAISFLNGEIEVRFKANTGEEDQGGGVIWRAQNKNNYYIARYNPLEDNFRIYYVKAGVRRRVGSARHRLPVGVWHKMKITHQGDRIEGYLNGWKLLEVTDRTITGAGGFGLWTKADAATSFDDLSIEVK